MIKVLLHEFEGTGLYESRMARIYRDSEGFIIEFYNNAVKLTEARIKSTEQLAEDIAENWALGDMEIEYEKEVIFTPEPSGSNDP